VGVAVTVVVTNSQISQKSIVSWSPFNKDLEGSSLIAPSLN
jgi:hypothetical protein